MTATPAHSQITTANGTGMDIHRIVKSIYTPQSRYVPSHCPSCHPNQKNLVSVHHFTNDHNAFIEYHPGFFLGQGLEQRQSFNATDVEMISILCNATINKQVMHVTMAFPTCWHSWLGHHVQALQKIRYSTHHTRRSVEVKRRPKDPRRKQEALRAIQEWVNGEYTSSSSNDESSKLPAPLSQASSSSHHLQVRKAMQVMNPLMRNKKLLDLLHELCYLYKFAAFFAKLQSGLQTRTCSS